jgi:hypothetical protein
MWPMVGLGAIMFGASVWLVYAGLFTNFQLPQMGPATGFFSILVGGFGVLFFGYAFFYILYRFLFPKGALIINADGIIDNTNAIGSKEVIRFEHMKEAKLEIIQATPQIGINLTNEQEYLNTLPWLKRKAQAINKKYFGTSTVSLNVPVESRERLEELIDTINARREFVQSQKDD